MTDKQSRQPTVSSLLARGVIFSTLWFMGVGSCYAILCATKARRIIKDSDGQLYGTWRVWWCFVVGGFGLALWVPVFLAMFWDAIVNR